MSQPQSAASHAKMVPMYHYVSFGLLAVPMIFFAYRTVTSFSLDALMLLAFVVGTVIAALYGRIFPLGVQDRVIRLEERMRLARVLPAEMHGDIDGIGTDLLIGLRFASDSELEGLTRRIVSGELKDRKSVKEAVQQWRPDHQRI